eukprot:snap_masked-scaffold_10-processed-gene-4.45-mRNA-1 protein AED:1.00 eAED:1.00 QI:0/-1/0/0/-1/1/1/0/346
MPRTVLFDEYIASKPDLTNLTVAITGTTSGTGFHTAQYALLKNCKTLFLLNRESGRSVSSLENLKELAPDSRTNLIPISCDLTSFSSVRAASDEIMKQLESSPLDILVNNAGVAYFPPSLTEDGFDITNQVNHLSHVLLTRLLLPFLLLSNSPRIIFHSSMARFNGGFQEKQLANLKGKSQQEIEDHLGKDTATGSVKRYVSSKVANSIFAFSLAKKFPQIRVTVADPGTSATEIANSAKRNDTPNGFSAFISTLLNLKISDLVVQSAADGALPLIHASFGSNDDVSSGDFIIPKYLTFGKPTLGSNFGQTSSFFWKWMESSISNSSEWERCFKVSEEAIGEKFIN